MSDTQKVVTGLLLFLSASAAAVAVAGTFPDAFSKPRPAGPARSFS
jgi:hypothetical protein